MGDQTMELQVHIRHITKEQAEEIHNAVSDAVLRCIGRLPNGTTYTVEPDWKPDPPTSAEPGMHGEGWALESPGARAQRGMG